MKTDYKEFVKFYDKLMSKAPEGYIPWIFPVKKDGKNPDGRAIYLKAYEKGCCGQGWTEIKEKNKIKYICPKCYSTKGGWKQEWARLTRDEAIKRLQNGFNVGISARMNDSLVLIDIDNWQKVGCMPKTLVNMSRSRCGLHGFAFKGEDKAKFNQPTEEGELRSVDQYVVCAGSYVPTNASKLIEELEEGHITQEEKEIMINDPKLGLYTVHEDNEPLTVMYDDLPKFFRDEFENNTKVDTDPKEEKIVKEEKKKINFSNTNKNPLFNLTFFDILGKDFPVEDRVKHPLHPSESEANFNINSTGTLANCWRHLVTLNPYQFLVAKSGLMTCKEAGSGHKNSNAGESLTKKNKEAYKAAEQEAIKLGLISEEEEEVSPMDVMSFQDLMDSDIQPVSYVIENLLSEEGITILGGDSGVGKSWLSLYLSLKLSGGYKVFNRFQSQKSKVLYIDEENGKRAMFKRLQMLNPGFLMNNEAPDYPNLILSNLNNVKLDTGNRNNETDGINRFKSLIMDHQPKVCVIDSFVRFFMGEENSSSDVSKVYDTLKWAIKEYKTSFILLHHTVKQNGNKYAKNSLRGSGDLSALCDNVIMCTKAPGSNYIKVEQLKNRHDRELDKPFSIVMKNDNDNFSIDYVQEVEISEDEKTKFKKQIIALCDIIATNDLIEFESGEKHSVFKQFKSKGYTKNNFHDVLGVLKEQKAIKFVKKGKYEINSLFKDYYEGL